MIVCVALILCWSQAYLEQKERLLKAAKGSGQPGRVQHNVRNVVGLQHRQLRAMGKIVADMQS